MRASRLLCGMAVLLVPLLVACTTVPEPESAVQRPTPTPTVQPVQTDSVEALLASMTLREKVGQLFMVRPDALDPDLPQSVIDDDKAEGVQQLSDAMRQTLRQYPVGGICQFGKNIADPEQITRFNADLQAASEIPLLIAVDEEGGRVARLARNPAFSLPQYESALAVGQTGNLQTAMQMGETIGGYLRKYGFTMDFAPVADVWSNPENTVIGDRAFSRDAATAAKMANAMADGLRKQGILPTFKHFPGHGDTAQDSHDGLAYTYRTAEEMRQCEWLPFLQGAQGKADEHLSAVMVGHIAVPALDATDTPASLSAVIVTDLLRREFPNGQDLLIATDSLAMGAITGQYTPGQACVQALQAGCDVLLMPNGLSEAFDTVLTAVQDGTVSEERLDESVARILRYKQQYAGLQAAAGQ